MKYRVLIEQDEDGALVAHVPALPGCVSQGSSRDEAVANVREAIAGYLESLRDHDEPFRLRSRRGSRLEGHPLLTDVLGERRLRRQRRTAATRVTRPAFDSLPFALPVMAVLVTAIYALPRLSRRRCVGARIKILCGRGGRGIAVSVSSTRQPLGRD